MSSKTDAKGHAWLSVIIPTYNGERRIADALDSVLVQEEAELEVVVVDDGSTDSTLEIVKSYAQSLNLKVIQRDHSGNWVSNTNHGILNCSGKYVCFLHQDDYWEKGRLGVIRTVLTGNPGVAMCFHPAWFVGPDGARVGLWKSPFSGGDVEIVPSEAFFECLLVQNFICVASPVFRRDDALKVGSLDDSLIYTADWDFWLKLTRLGPVAHIPAPLAYFAVHPESQTQSLSRRPAYVEQQLFCVLRRHFEGYKATGKVKARLLKAASFSVNLNVALMKFSSGQGARWSRLLRDFVCLGPQGWARFFRCSRILDRVLARLRIRLRRCAA
jgi:glycosyltransferase involved in cell wall biosynthesis